MFTALYIMMLGMSVEFCVEFTQKCWILWICNLPMLLHEWEGI